MDNYQESQTKRSAKATFLTVCAILSVVYLFFSFALNAFADPPTSPYLPGETLSPTCSPTSTDCTVDPPLFSTTTLPLGGVLFVNDGSGTITANTSSLYWNASSSIFEVGTSPTQGATDTLILIGNNLISGGAASGTWLGVNAAASSNADFLNFENNSSSLFKIASSGAVTINEGAGAQAQILAAVVPTTDLFHIANSAATAVTTAGINNIQSDYVGGTGAIEAANIKLTVTAGPTSGSIWDGLRIVENTTTQAGVTENGIKIDPITNATGTENAFFVGNGWQTGLLVAENPAAQANASLIQLASTSIEGGNSASGTFIGINPSAFGGDFLNFQVNSTTEFDVSATGTALLAGNITVKDGSASLGVSSSTEGQLILNDSLTNFPTILEANTSTASALTFVLPNGAGAAGETLVTDGSGNLSWGNGAGIVIASTTAYVPLTTTLASSTANGTISPSSVNSQIWVTVNLVASSTAATTTVTTGIYASSTCTTQIGNSVTSSIARTAVTTVPQTWEISVNVVSAPATTTSQKYYVCSKYTGTLTGINSAEITLQDIRAGSDLAETYNAATGTPLAAGDVASLDPTIEAGVQQSQSTYDSTLVGIISTEPGAVLGNNDPSSGAQVLVALSGRVPVNVTNDNGNISVGDYLTSSDIPGLAMRSTQPGRVVGVAMENFAPDPSTGVTTGTILAFVNPGWQLGNLTSTTDIASSSWALQNASSSGGPFILDQFTAYVQAALAKLGVAISNGVATLQGIVANNVTTNELCVQGTCINGAQLSNLLGNTNSDSSPSSASSSSVTSDGNGTDDSTTTVSSADVSSTTDPTLQDSSSTGSSTDISITDPSSTDPSEVVATSSADGSASSTGD